MCLRRKTFNELNGESGIGYKIVKLGPKPGEFKPYYPFFISDMISICPGSSGLMRKEKGAIKARVIYKIGRTYRVKHKRTTLTSYNGYEDPIEYPAGVHLYKEPQIGEFNLVCRYAKAVAEDHETVVAMEVTPLRYEKFDWVFDVNQGSL